MPRSSLTPLGKQLRFVLVSIRPSYTNTDRPRFQSLPNPKLERARDYHGSPSTSSAVQAEAVADLGYTPFGEEPVLHGASPEQRQREINRPRSKRRVRFDRIAQALRSTGQAASTPANFPHKKNLSYANVQSPRWRSDYGRNAKRFSRRRIVDAAEDSLDAILASFIRYRASDPITDSLSQSGQSSWTLSLSGLALLQRKGLSEDDFKDWADIVSLPDPLAAAQALSTRLAIHGPQSVPIFVLLYLLRRPYLSPRALRVMLQDVWTIFSHRKSDGKMLGVPENAVFLAFVRLLRHAREVWPRALENISQFLVHFLPDAISKGEEPSIAQLARLTFMLNKAMRLVAAPTAAEPFKNNQFQEAALVAILRYMAEHEPPLQTTREGYRAVVVVQLAQRKTDKEQQWAQLKALSWPPWKQERTAMDADITHEEHGTSKARETVMRMAEAGYGNRDWEKLALMYAGWDIDHTPTIQTLTTLGIGLSPHRLKNALWAARITTTRTAQEAWACYLAYEDKKLPRSQDVYLAIFRKLHKEEGRQRDSDLTVPQHLPGAWHVHAGDKQEVEPLPPSTHLYTHTRKPIPTLDGLYRQLRQQGITFGGRCLAFLVQNADSLQLGVEYLRDSALRPFQSSSHLDSETALMRLPISILSAYIGLLSRFGTVPYTSMLLQQHRRLLRHAESPPILSGEQILRSDLAIIQAIEVLMEVRPNYRPAWNSVLTGLARGLSLARASSLLLLTNARTSLALWTAHERRAQGAILAHRLVLRVLSLMEQCKFDLDAHGFHKLCQTTEKAAKGYHSILSRQPSPKSKPYAQQALELMESSSHTERLQAEFRALTGDDGVKSGVAPPRAPSQGGDPPPIFLELPSPAVLHSYIRALGWMAEYSALLALVRWMVENDGELRRKRELDRLGEKTFRRSLIAIRVFSERSWLSHNELSAENNADEEDWLTASASQARRLRTPAAEDIIEEMRGLVESRKEWGGWPQDHEVKEYCSPSSLAHSATFHQ